MGYSTQEVDDLIRKADKAGDEAAVRRLLEYRGQVSAQPAAAQSPWWGDAKPKPRTAMQQTGDILTNAVAGAAQGITTMPDTAIEGIAALMRMGVTPVAKASAGMFRGLGMGGAADSVDRNAQTFDRALAAPATGYRAIEAIAPTRPGFENSRLASQIVGGFMTPFAPKKASLATIPRQAPQVVTRGAPRIIPNADDVIATGERFNVPVKTTDVRPPRTFMGRMARRTGEIIPLIGTGGGRAAQQTARVEATKEFVSEYGVSGMDDIFAGRGNMLDDVAANLSATRGGRIKALTSAKTGVMNRLDSAGPVRAPQALREIETQIRNLAGINREAYAPVIKELQDFGTQLMQGKTLNQIEGNRKILGSMFKRPELAAIADDGQKAVNAIYGPLRADMGNFIRQKGGDAAFGQWKGANDQLAGMAGELRNNTLKSVFRDADMTPEAVGKLLFSGKRSDVARLYGNLDDVGRAKGRAALMQRVAEVSSKGGNDINPDTFARGVKDLGGQLGVFFSGRERAELEGFTRLLKATSHAPEAGMMLNTGAQNMPIAAGWAAGSFLGSAAIPVAAAGGVLARVYESAPVRNALVALSRTRPGTPAAATAMQKANTAILSAQRLMGAGAVVGREANDLLTTSVPRAVSAGETPEDQQRQQRGF
jgi:hypothetical protein